MKVGKSKKESAEVSGAGTLVIGKKEYKEAKERSGYGKGGGLMDPGKYVFAVESGEVTESKGEATKGSQVYTLRLRADSKHAANNGTGGVVFFRATVHGNTFGQVLNFLDAFGIEEEYTKELPDGSTQFTPVPKSVIEGLKGREVIGHVTVKKAVLDKAGNTIYSEGRNVALDPIDGEAKPKKGKAPKAAK